MRHHGSRKTSHMRTGLALLGCGLALGAASSVAVVNALYDMVR